MVVWCTMIIMICDADTCRPEAHWCHMIYEKQAIQSHKTCWLLLLLLFWYGYLYKERHTSIQRVFVCTSFDIMYAPSGAIHLTKFNHVHVYKSGMKEWNTGRQCNDITNKYTHTCIYSNICKTHKITYNISKCNWHRFPPFNPCIIRCSCDTPFHQIL